MQLLNIKKIAEQYPGGQVLFEEPLTIEDVFTIYGLWSGENGLFVLDGNGEWHGPLLENQANANLMITGIFVRLKSMAIPSAVVANYDNQVNAVIFE